MPYSLISTGSATNLDVLPLTLLSCGCSSPLMAVASCLHRFYSLKKGVATTVLACMMRGHSNGENLHSWWTTRKM